VLLPTNDVSEQRNVAFFMPNEAGSHASRIAWAAKPRRIVAGEDRRFDTLVPLITVIDYRAGNSPSVMYALRKLGLPARLAATTAEVAEAERIILPGVGAAGATLESLHDSALVEPLAQRVGEGVPFLGICIGLQVLFDHSEEGDTDGLGWLGGSVRRFSDSQRVPQIGWNQVRFARPHPLVAAVPDASHFYFVNSYYAVPSDPTDTLGLTQYGHEFASIVARGNIAATQFHAEKSGRVGLRLLENFATWDGT
jgi:glutamine amidotransferase